MAAKAHAILSTSSSDRWLHCPPSARLCETYEDKGSDYAAEGPDAHALGEYKLKAALGLPAEDPTESLTWYSEEMDDCTSGYTEYVLEQIEAAKETCTDPVVLIEQRVDFSRWVEQGFGTADCIIIADGTLRVIDYKHGLGVLVSAEANPQMQCCALGALKLFDDIYDIDTVSMTIYQPRRQNVSTFEISKDDLYCWADEVLKPTAELAFAGDGNFLCGEWCGFCKAKNECRTRAEVNLRLTQHEFKLPPLLTDTEIEAILDKVDELVSWASDIKEYALQQALSGKEWTGFKLVEGRCNRRYSNEDAVIDAVMKKFWNTIQFVFAALGGWLNYFLGGYDGLLIALIIFVVCDYITDIMCAIADKKLSSEVGFKGICRKVLIFLLVGIGNVVDVQVLGAPGVLRTAVIFFYLSNEGLSLTENAAHLGLPVPKKLKKVLEQLHDHEKENHKHDD